MSPVAGLRGWHGSGAARAMDHTSGRGRSPTATGDRRMDAWMGQQATNGPSITITGLRIGIQIPQHHKGGRRLQSPLATGIIPQVIRTIEIIAPQPDLVMVAAAIAPLGAIKHRRHRMAQQQMQQPQGGYQDFDEKIPFLM